MSGSVADTSEPAADRAARLAELEARLGYEFRDRSLLDTALRHASRAHESGDQSNERLEFLGDAVLGLVVAHVLFDAHPDWSEGDLTRAKSSVVAGSALARLGLGLGLGEFLELGRTERRSGGASKDKILEDAIEAVVGAIYLDSGFDEVEGLVRREFPDVLDPGAAPVARDPKTVLNEQARESSGEYPQYELVRDSEVDHDELRFTVHVLVRDQVLGEGSGRSKRAAEVAAAEAALAAEAPTDG
jgi:ribonuclease-3